MQTKGATVMVSTLAHTPREALAEIRAQAQQLKLMGVPRQTACGTILVAWADAADGLLTLGESPGDIAIGTTLAQPLMLEAALTCAPAQTRDQLVRQWGEDLQESIERTLWRFAEVRGACR